MIFQLIFKLFDGLFAILSKIIDFLIELLDLGLSKSYLTLFRLLRLILFLAYELMLSY